MAAFTMLNAAFFYAQDSGHPRRYINRYMKKVTSMRTIYKKYAVGILIAVLSASLYAQGVQVWQVLSPDSNVSIILKLDSAMNDISSPMGLYYTVIHKNDTVIHWSALGLTLTEPQLSAQLTYQEDSLEAIDEFYTLASGKRRINRNTCSQRTVTFDGGSGLVLSVVLRAYDNGAAFRYLIQGSYQVAVHEEHSGFVLPFGARVWMQPITKNYEAEFDSFTVGDSGDFDSYGCFPILARTPSSKWTLISEASVYDTYAASRFRVSDSAINAFSIRLVQSPIGSVTPWEMPWRAVIVGDSLSDIVESCLIENLNPNTELTDVSWIKPGRVAWSWWSDNDSPDSLRIQKQYVDFASDMGWEYVLVDDGWDATWIQELVEYAAPKNVDILVWFSWTAMDAPLERSVLLDQLVSWGVKGIKVDFIDKDSPDRMQFYNDVLSDAAQRQLVVNFHGATLPRGQRRYWPNLLAVEAVRGAEHYPQVDEVYGDPSPWQNCILPFTRNVVGPMDYTPVTFSAAERTTSNAHELALSVVFECGLQHFADSPESYTASGALEFLKAVPSSWDDTRFLAGYPGEYACVARRKGKDWFFAGINAGPQHQVTLSLADIPLLATSHVVFYTDSSDGSLRAVDTTLALQTDLTIDMAANGGFCFMADDSYDSTKDTVTIAENMSNGRFGEWGIHLRMRNNGYECFVRDAGKIDIQIFDARGRRVFFARKTGNMPIHLSRSQLTSGLNVVRVTTSRTTYAARLFCR